jgi:hypothetical protein
MKKIIFFLLLLLMGVAAHSNPIKVDERIQKLFAEAFPKAKSVTWYGNETHYEVVFFYKDAQCRITYRLDGVVERTERYYSAEDLPPFVLSRVKRNYDGYRIHGITEITTELGMTYYIILEGEQKWVQIQADELGNSYLVKRFKRSEAALLPKGL